MILCILPRAINHVPPRAYCIRFILVGSLPEVLIEHVQSATFDHMHSRELHELPNPCFVISTLTRGLALLTHGLWFVGAYQSISLKAINLKEKEVFSPS